MNPDAIKLSDLGLKLRRIDAKLSEFAGRTFLTPLDKYTIQVLTDSRSETERERNHLTEGMWGSR